MSREILENSGYPIYNIGTVARMTGVPVTSLHAWERRYDFPHQPKRTAGGHRLYSEFDVSLLRSVKNRIDQGVTTHQAILAVQHGLAQGSIQNELSSLAVRPSIGGNFPENYLERLRAYLIRNNLPQADRLLGDLMTLYPIEDLILNVVGPVLQSIGDDWQNGQVPIAEEHLASHYLRQRLIMWMETGPEPINANPIALACAPGEWHEGSLLMLGVLMRRRGWPVAYLGQNVPLSSLQSLIDQDKPSAIVFVSMIEETAQTLSAWPQWLTLKNERPVVTFGGRAYIDHPDLIDGMKGIYLGDDLRGGMGRLIGLIQKPA
jgi:DNA-binding transcriptional MerR regulator